MSPETPGRFTDHVPDLPEVEALAEFLRRQVVTVLIAEGVTDADHFAPMTTFNEE